MTHYKCLVSFAFVFFTVILSYSQSVSRALIIAIGDYPRVPEKQLVWDDLASDHDLEILKSTLIGYGFSSGNIDEITDFNATKSGILKAFDELISKTREGDIVHIHISAHGQQITDLNGDESDGYDESIICYDAPAYYVKGYSGELHLLDDEIEQCIRRLCEKLGSSGHLLATFDTCHSGTMTRGENSVQSKKRGSDKKFDLPDTLKSSFTQQAITEDFSGWFDQLSAKRNGASVTAFSACQPNEVNYEVRDNYGKGYGSLTFAFCQALKQGKSESRNYQDLYLAMKSVMRTQINRENPSIVQTPCFDGNLQTLIYSGTLIPSDPSFEIKNATKDQIEVAAGLLEGLNLHDTLSVRAIDGKREIFRAEIIQIGANSCMLNRPKRIALGNNLSAYDAMLSSTFFEHKALQVAVLGTKKHLKALQKQNTGTKILFSSDTMAAAVIARIDGDSRVTLTRADDKSHIVRKINKLTIDSAEFIIKELEKLKLVHDFASIEIQELQHVQTSFQRGELLETRKSNDDFDLKDGRYVHAIGSWEKGIVGSFKKDDILIIHIENKNSFPIHVLAVSLMNDYFFPEKSEWESKPIQPGESTPIVYRINERDLSYKLIVSTVEFNLSNNPVISAGTQRGGTEIENLLFPQGSLTRDANEHQYLIQNFFVHINP